MAHTSTIRLIAASLLLLPLFSHAPRAAGGVECTVASLRQHAPAGTTIKAASALKLYEPLRR